MTYKKAARLCKNIFRDRGLALSSSAEKQAGYLVLYATEGEISKNLHHDLKERIKIIGKGFTPGSIEDKHMIEKLESYADLLRDENPEGGEIDVGWIIEELKRSEILKHFCPCV